MKLRAIALVCLALAATSASFGNMRTPAGPRTPERPPPPRNVVLSVVIVRLLAPFLP